MRLANRIRITWLASSAVVCGMAVKGLLGWPHMIAMFLGTLLINEEEQ